MKYKIIHMDGRYTRYDFTHLIEFRNYTLDAGILDFDRCRRWFNDQYGWSQDIDTRARMTRNQKHHPDVYADTDINPIWAYATRFDNLRIYVADSKALSWFVLCHPKS